MNKKPSGMAELPTVNQLKKLAATDVEQWRKLLITGGARLPFGSSSTYDTHPLRAYFEKHRIGETDKFIYTDLFLLSAESLGIVDSPSSNEFLTLRSFTARSMHLYLHPSLLDGVPEDNLNLYLMKFFESIQEDVGYALLEVAEKVAYGVPLYKIDPTDGSATLLSDSEQPSPYLTGKWIHREVNNRTYSLPTWVDGHAFRKSDLEALSLFFGGELNENQVSARRLAYRTHLGMEAEPLSPAPNTSMSSKLMAALHLVRSRYYGNNFLLSDQQTWPKQKDVVAWLRATLSLSEREAEAVDIVARPDALRGKA